MSKDKNYAASKEKNMQRAKKKIIQRAKKKIIEQAKKLCGEQRKIMQRAKKKICRNTRCGNIFVLQGQFKFQLMPWSVVSLALFQKAKSCVCLQ